MKFEIQVTVIVVDCVRPLKDNGNVWIKKNIKQAMLKFIKSKIIQMYYYQDIQENTFNVMNRELWYADNKINSSLYKLTFICQTVKQVGEIL